MSITIERHHNPTDHYTLVSNAFLRARVPVSAFRVGCYVLSHSTNFVLTQERIAEALEMSRTTVAKALKDLEELGYLIAKPVRSPAGHKVGTRLMFSDRGFTAEERQSLSKESGHRDTESVPNICADECPESVQHKKTISKKTKEISESADSDLDLGVVPQPKPKARKTAMPPAWKPPAALFSFGDSLHLSYSDVELEADRFRDWVAANNVKYVDWTAAFRNWLRRAAEMKSRGANRPGRFENAGRDERSGLRVER